MPQGARQSEDTQHSTTGQVQPLGFCARVGRRRQMSPGRHSSQGKGATNKSPSTNLESKRNGACLLCGLEGILPREGDGAQGGLLRANREARLHDRERAEVALQQLLPLLQPFALPLHLLPHVLHRLPRALQEPQRAQGKRGHSVQSGRLARLTEQTGQRPRSLDCTAGAWGIRLRGERRRTLSPRLVYSQQA